MYLENHEFLNIENYQELIGLNVVTMSFKYHLFF